MTPLPPKDLPYWHHRDHEANYTAVTGNYPCYDCGGSRTVATCDTCMRPVCIHCFCARHEQNVASEREAFPCPLAAMPDMEATQVEPND